MDMSSPQMMVFQALQCACSQNCELMKPAEEKLSEFEIQPGFYSTLLGIFSDQTVDGQIRWMATLCFKNGMGKYWRRHAPNEIQAEEKATIKAQLISSFNEPVPQIAVQLAVIIAKIARLDCPRDWPELIPKLVEAIQIDNLMQQHQALLVLQHVVKALSTKRLAADRKVYEELSESVYQFILNLWDGFTNLYFQSVQEGVQNCPGSVLYLEKSLLSLKILRKLTIYGFSKPHKYEPCMLFIKALFQRLKESLECRLRVRSFQNLFELTEKFISKQMKILIEFLELHPISSVEFIPLMLDFSFTYVFNEGTNLIFEDNALTFETFATQCINLTKGILSSNVFGSSGKTASVNSEEILRAIKCKEEFFTQERISYICEKMIMHYFLLTQHELEAWDENPESYASDEGGDSWKYSLKACTETFFLTLFNQFRQEVIPEVVKLAQKAQMTHLTQSSSLKDILLKDAIYNAVGLGAFNLFDDIDFDQWFSTQLLHELKLSGSNFRIIRRRVIWLIGRWTGVKFSQSLRPQVYSVCLELLMPEEDMSVRLAASKTLMSTMDDFEFISEDFLQFLEPSFSLLFALLKEAKECETKMNVLTTMSFIVDKMSENINSQMDKLIQYLPLLWEESESHNMLRCAIISTLLQIVKALRDIPVQLAPFLYPVIGISTNVNEPSHVYLLEEGLELWLIVIENSTSMTPELLNLCDNILPIIEISSENLRTVLFIIQSYILLDSKLYLEKYGAKVVATCVYLLTDMRSDGIRMIMKLFESMLRAMPELGVELLKPALPDIFTKVYEDKEYPMVMSMYLSIIGRVLLINQLVFSQVLQNINVPQAFDKILDIWITKMPLVSNLERRKLLSLALASLITVQNDILFERLGLILSKICETLNDIMKEDDESGTLQDTLLFSECVDMNGAGMWNLEDFEFKTHHYERCQQLAVKDPVYSIVLKDYLQSQLVALRNQLGEERYQMLMLSVDSQILTNLTDFVNVGTPIPANA